MKLESSRQIFEKNIQISNFMKIFRVVAKLFHAGGRAGGRDEINSGFPKLCERA